MLKRQQILLTNYLIDYIRHNAEKYDMSFSEVIRLSLCVQFGNWIKENYPECKFKFTHHKMKKMLTRIYGRKRMEEDHHRLMSDLYFETRKAIEFALAKEKK